MPRDSKDPTANNQVFLHPFSMVMLKTLWCTLCVMYVEHCRNSITVLFSGWTMRDHEHIHLGKIWSHSESLSFYMHWTQVCLFGKGQAKYFLQAESCTQDVEAERTAIARTINNPQRCNFLQCVQTYVWKVMNSTVEKNCLHPQITLTTMINVLFLSSLIVFHINA